jgi:hypothetical protein
MKFLITAPGPSLDKEEINYAYSRVHSCIHINSSIDLISHGDICYSSDPAWFRYFKPEFLRFNEMLCPFDSDGHSTTIPYERGTGFSNKTLHLGHSSGFAAVSLALLRGAKEIYLLGYDMGYNKNNDAHFFGDYPEALHKKSPYKKFIEDFEVSKKDLDLFGATIFNCTINSAMDTFIKTTIKEVL